MLFRFSLYGFLKNQRYFEPFLVLVLVDKGLSFASIGLLYAVRELTVNCFEIPSGAIADSWGRRNAMILAFVAYIASFLLFGMADQFPLIAAAMFLFGIGEAFRTGTHKAMIFAWLHLHGRIDERTKIYGYTRSWSKLGSAFSVVVATAIVIVSNGYEYVFYLAVIPYVICIINFLGYPSELNRASDDRPSIRDVMRRMVETFRDVLRRRNLRRVVVEGMAFDGTFGTVKDYLQPVLAAAAVFGAVAIIANSTLSATQQSAIFVGAAYLVLHLLSAVASRQAHHIPDMLGDEQRASRLYWAIGAALFLAIAIGAYREIISIVIGAFVLVHVLQNLWRPVLVSRLALSSSESQRATTLSIESMARRVVMMIVAPLLGWAVDAVTTHDIGGMFWPVGAVGAIVFLFFAITYRRSQ